MGHNRAERRAARSTMRKRRSWDWHEKAISDADRSQYPACRAIVRAFFNDLYSVQVYHVGTDMGLVQHAIVRVQDGGEPPWRDLQRIKDELFGPDAYAVQVYPRRADVVDQADVYHLWLLPDELPFGLHRENGLRKTGPEPRGHHGI